VDGVLGVCHTSKGSRLRMSGIARQEKSTNWSMMKSEMKGLDSSPYL
jgi:hypothetical protein